MPQRNRLDSGIIARSASKALSERLFDAADAIDEAQERDPNVCWPSTKGLRLNAGRLAREERQYADKPAIRNLDPGAADEEMPDLLDRAAELVVEARFPSPSFLQRKLCVPYETALGLLDEMESRGIVGPRLGHQQRAVLVETLADLQDRKTAMSQPTMQWTAADLLTLLRRHYQPENRPAAGLFAPEIESPDGSRRADLIWAPTTSTGGFGLVGHELKISRSDLLVELADPAKCDPWARFCECWWLVVADPAMIDDAAIPHAWGVLAPPSGRRTRSMTIIKPAPKLHPVEPARAFRKLMT